MRAEKVLLKAGLAVKLIPVPREFSSDCGVALRFAWEQHDQVQGTLNTAQIEIAGCHRLPSAGND